jgi:cysteinyl-tRNA synthetase, unknown class
VKFEYDSDIQRTFGVLMKSVVTFLRRLFLLSILAGGLYASSMMPMVRTGLAPRDGLALSGATSWGYQLQEARADRIASTIDVMVIDAQRQSSPPRPISSDEVARYRLRPDGRPRIVLAYMSIGEAETYRPYWWSHWRVLGPSWLGRENKEWKGNYHVRYWEPGWRRIIVDPRPSMLDRGLDMLWPARKPYIDQILDAGFDGVYLDRVDAYDEWRQQKPGAEEAMMAFVAEISDYAKGRRPGFMVVPQNGEELLRNVSYRRKIDGIAKEDLLFGNKHTEAVNSPEDVTASIRLLNMARADRLPVFVVEYLADAGKRQQAEARSKGLGYILHFAHRELNRPPEVLFEVQAPAPRPVAPPPPPPPAVPSRSKG